MDAEVLYVDPHNRVYSNLAEADQRLFEELRQELVEVIDMDFLYGLSYERTEVFVRHNPGDSGEYITHWSDGGWVDSSEKMRERLDEYIPEDDWIGSGSFADVWVCPWDSTKVIKIGTGHAHDGDPTCDGWLEYAAWCIQNPMPLIVPVIHALALEEVFFVSLLDRYDETLSDYDTLDDPENMMPKKNAIYAALRGYGYESGMDREYYTAAVRIKETSEINFNDMHDGNFMIRKSDGAVILTDPSSNSVTGEGIRDILRELGIIA